MQIHRNHTTLPIALLSMALIVSLTSNSDAQRSRARKSTGGGNKPAVFTKPISSLQPVLLKRFTADSVAFDSGGEISDAMKNQQKELALREIAQQLYTRMTRKGFSVYSFERTPPIARDNMRGAIVIEGSLDKVKMGENRPIVEVTIKIYAADDPNVPLATIPLAGDSQLVANRVTRSFILSSGGE